MDHPIKPPPELVRQWLEDGPKDDGFGISNYIATAAARWGSDQELDACINYFREYDTSWGEDSELITGLRTARRPKPPSLKEQALANTNAILNDPNRALLTEVRETLELNRRALEQLDD